MSPLITSAEQRRQLTRPTCDISTTGRRRKAVVIAGRAGGKGAWQKIAIDATTITDAGLQSEDVVHHP